MILKLVEQYIEAHPGLSSGHAAAMRLYAKDPAISGAKAAELNGVNHTRLVHHLGCAGINLKKERKKRSGLQADQKILAQWPELKARLDGTTLAVKHIAKDLHLSTPRINAICEQQGYDLKARTHRIKEAVCETMRKKKSDSIRKKGQYKDRFDNPIRVMTIKQWMEARP